MSTTKKVITRIKDGRWCDLEVELKDGRLSICGSEGVIMSRRDAKREALAHWESYFAEDREALGDMAIRFGTRSAKSAARKVIEVDGEFHGLDLAYSHEYDPKNVHVLESCGQIRETLVAYFPEIAPYLKYHLNDMHAECEHQESRGETYSTHPSAKCPDCGYVLGSAWTKRELPKDVIRWFESLEQLAEPPARS